MYLILLISTVVKLTFILSLSAYVRSSHVRLTRECFLSVRGNRSVYFKGIQDAEMHHRLRIMAVSYVLVVMCYLIISKLCLRTFSLTPFCKNTQQHEQKRRGGFRLDREPVSLEDPNECRAPLIHLQPGSLTPYDRYRAKPP